ncbi:MAG: OmpA family protein [Myxococcales bacterium]
MDNMLDISREAFPNPALTRLSSVLHESESATQRGIDRAFPASLTGLAEHAKRGHNAEEMLGHFQKGDYPHLTPAEITPLVHDPVQTAKCAASGEGYLAQIFGSKLDQVVDMVAHQAGVSRTSAHVILGLSAPLLLDALEKESSIRQLDAEGLSRFLSDQEEHAHSLLPGIVDGAASAAAGKPMRIQPGTDVAEKPLFAQGPGAMAYSSTAAAVSGGIPVAGLHVHARGQTPTLDEGVEESFQEPSKLTRGLLWLVGALALIALISWGLMRLAPRPQVPAVPQLPDNVGTSEPARDRGASVDTSLPGGVGMAMPSPMPAPSEAASEAAISASKPAAMPAPQNRPHTPAMPATPAPNVTGGVTTSAETGTGRQPRLAGDEAVRALKKNEPLGPRADAVSTVSPPDSETGVASLGVLEKEATPAIVDPPKQVEGIVETQRTNVSQARSARKLPAYFVGGALPPQRFIVKDLEFAEGSAELPHDNKTLDRTARTLREQPGANVVIEGYADDPTSAEHTAELSLERAESVKDYLVEHGVPEHQLEAVGMRDARRDMGLHDRRVELVVLTR